MTAELGLLLAFRSGAHRAPLQFLDGLLTTANILRLAAHALSREQGRLGESVRRWKARLGSPKAITAMAHT